MKIIFVINKTQAQMFSCEFSACNFIKNKIPIQLFSGKVCKIFKNYFAEHLWRTCSNDMILLNSFKEFIVN